MAVFVPIIMPMYGGGGGAMPKWAIALALLGAVGMLLFMAGFALSGFKAARNVSALLGLLGTAFMCICAALLLVGVIVMAVQDLLR